MIYRKYKDDYNALFDPDLDPALDPTAPDAARFLRVRLLPLVFLLRRSKRPGGAPPAAAME